jgi:hypothetical protein
VGLRCLRLGLIFSSVFVVLFACLPASFLVSWFGCFFLFFFFFSLPLFLLLVLLLLGCWAAAGAGFGVPNPSLLKMKLYFQQWMVSLKDWGLEGLKLRI